MNQTKTSHKKTNLTIKQKRQNKNKLAQNIEGERGKQNINKIVKKKKRQ